MCIIMCESIKISSIPLNYTIYAIFIKFILFQWNAVRSDEGLTLEMLALKLKVANLRYQLSW